MTTYNTRNPLGSAAVKDLFDNAENLDFAVNSITQAIWSDRFGRPRKTWYGMESAFLAQLASQEARFNAFIERSGYDVIGDYEDGPLTITEYNQLVRYQNELWKITADTDIPFTTAGNTAESWNASDRSHFVSVGDAALRQNLGSNEQGLGSYLVAAFPNGNLYQQLYHRFNVMQYGAVDDGDFLAGAGTDNYQAIQNCIDAAVEARCSEVVIPGCFAYRGTLKLCGSVTPEVDDDVFFVRLVGINSFTSGLVCLNSGNNDIAVELASPDYGSQISGGIFNMHLRGVSSAGIGVEFRGTSHQYIDRCYIRGFGIGVHVYNRDEGQFNEFLHIDNSVIDSNKSYDVLFEIKDGDASFHGCSFSETTLNVAAGGVGVGCIGTSTTSVNLYNCFWDLHIFGRFDVTTETFAMDIINCFSTENMNVNIACERPLTFRARGPARFHSKGILAGHGALTFTCLNEEKTQQGQFVFSNITSKTANKNKFSNSIFSAYYPDVYNPSMAADIVGVGGIFTRMFRKRSSGVDALCFANYGNTANNQFSFGYIPVGNDLSAFVPTFEIDNYGGYIKTYNASITIDIRKQDGSDEGAGLVMLPSTVRPKSNNQTALGTPGYYFTSLNTTAWSVGPEDITPRTTATGSIGSATRYPANIYSQNAVTVVSDVNLKPVREELSDAEISAATACGKLFIKYKLASAIAEKDGGARYHIGVIAQSIMQVFTDNGLDYDDYGIITTGVSKQAVKQSGEHYYPVLFGDDDASTIPLNGDGFIDIITGMDELVTSDSGLTLIRTTHLVRYEELLCFVNAGIIKKMEKLEDLVNKM